MSGFIEDSLGSFPLIRGSSCSCNLQVLAVIADLTKEAEVRSLVDATISHFGRLDVLVSLHSIQLRLAMRKLE